MTAPEIAPNRRSYYWEGLGIFALALLLNLVGNGRVSLWDRDEPLYAECTREMRASGDWIHPTFNAEPRYKKPVLIYWLMLAGTAIGGDNPFGARLVSAVAGSLTCLLLWGFGTRVLGRRNGRVGALIYLTAPIVVINSKLATTDATLAFFFLACQASLWVLSRRESRLAAASFWTCLALATLTKGPVGPAMIGLSGLASWMLGGPIDYWKRLHWRWGFALFLAMTLPWYVAIGIVTHGEFYRVAIGSQVIRRITTGMEDHGAFPGYYPVTTMLTFYPWSALLPAAIVVGFVKRKSNPVIGFLLGWMIGPMILLECVRTKLVHYYLPAYPACALLVAMLIGWVADSDRNLRRWPMGRFAMGTLSGLGLTLLIVALGGVAVLPWLLKWPCLALATVLGVGTFFASESLRAGKTERGAFGLAGTWAGVMLLVGVWLLPAVEPYRFPQQVARQLAATASRENARPLLASFQEPSIIYELGKPTAVIKDRAWLHDLVDKSGAVVTPITAQDKALLKRDKTLELTVSGTITGFNLSKWRKENLEMVVIRRTGPVASRPTDQRDGETRVR